MFAFNKIRFKDKRQMFFYMTYIQTYIQGFLSRGWEENTKVFRELLSNILFFSISLHRRKQWKASWEMHFPAFSKETILNFSHPSAPTMGALRESLNLLRTVCPKNPRVRQ